MIGILIIAIVTIITGILLKIYDDRHKKTLSGEQPEHTEENPIDSECCGKHETCIKILSTPPEPVYFDDEELDRFADKDPSEFTDNDIEEIRDIMLTLAPGEAPEWAQSLRMRHISLPPSISAELEMLVTEELTNR